MKNVDMLSKLLIKSWATIDEGIHTTDEILQWVIDTNKNIKVNINKIPFEECQPWYYDEATGIIRNNKGSFFQISGLQLLENDSIVHEQPILLQSEIGYLGILCKEIDGVIYFLMQAKIEPGNINKVQISPTIQATKSNFTQVHGGRKPAYLDYFINANKYEILVDQIQSEQSSRFYKKRNRNIIIKIDEDIEISPNHKWMTLGQLKQLMKYNNLVNMDTRTVISCMPLQIDNNDVDGEIRSYFHDRSLYNSMLRNNTYDIPCLYNYINNQKMFSNYETKIVPLKSLESWNICKDEIVCKDESSFKVIFCDIQIEGREVSSWKQPLFEAIGRAIFGLICCNFNGVKKFLVQCKQEVGCFDYIEIAPTVQLEANYTDDDINNIDTIFFELYNKGFYIKHDVLLSEEGGRFYHEQNKNIVIEIDGKQLNKLSQLPEGYFWTDYKTLNNLVQINNCLNIQLRNLLSLLEV
ncbi:dNDP-4-keto-6-deoxy-glucose-2,3- dehydratase [Clostridium botulinum]|uniref:NDP-hexose 2,3-dehydratase family protein n=1 Tax=Clostridium botulinum TaxID=1491 RepID=UPI000597313F|nr:NDP-hexose 2,3-dehydratase family protein [Clostridium botulinum]KIL08037.1 dNDP-4-keto-6-deoxy-glucose-2,3- dehydratase [Clostridium botulinum]MBY6933624.1 NDP-hexose 2,3-dehydratase family protein [Clostridium botulinum]NFL83041.1 dNDP-4-keto-6-deoxy-glucose-2,3- dehydratase [Clostridium botulinum]NFN10465.1 dNDP-4-keto-6-deoxy-glucose-2,3- dehydratase [Clostridium botulinum]NFO35631.1 dNDP-4-keto-6-deoxy-glucose-2,3- dehydratase [Clostridium botulinum]